VSMKTVIYPVEEEGAVFEFLFNKEGLNTRHSAHPDTISGI